MQALSAEARPTWCSPEQSRTDLLLCAFFPRQVCSVSEGLLFGFYKPKEKRKGLSTGESVVTKGIIPSYGPPERLGVGLVELAKGIYSGGNALAVPDITEFRTLVIPTISFH